MPTFVTLLILVSACVVTISRGAEPHSTTVVNRISKDLANHYHGSGTWDFIPQCARRQPPTQTSNRALRYFAVCLAILGGVMFMLGIFDVFDAPDSHASHQSSTASWLAHITSPSTEVITRSNHDLNDFLKYSGILVAALGLFLYLCACDRQQQQQHQETGNPSNVAPQPIEIPMVDQQLLMDQALLDHYDEPPPLYGSAEMAHSPRSLPPPPAYESACNAQQIGEAVEVVALTQPAPTPEEANTEGASAGLRSSPPPSFNAPPLPLSPSPPRKSAETVNQEEDPPSSR